MPHVQPSRHALGAHQDPRDSGESFWVQPASPKCQPPNSERYLAATGSRREGWGHRLVSGGHRFLQRRRPPGGLHQLLRARWRPSRPTPSPMGRRGATPGVARRATAGAGGPQAVPGVDTRPAQPHESRLVLGRIPAADRPPARSPSISGRPSPASSRNGRVGLRGVSAREPQPSLAGCAHLAPGPRPRH